jgi:hypothetical protein
MAHALQQVLYGTAGREQRIACSQRYIKRFQNSDAAQQMVDVYNSITIA